MTATPASYLQQHPAFQDISAEAFERICSKSEFLTFHAGQPICRANLIPSKIIVILDGHARLIIEDQGKPRTLKKLFKDDVVGLASILQTSGCEEVAASSLVQGIAISDAEVVRLIEEDPKFLQWCTTRPWPAELYSVLKVLTNNQANDDSILLKSIDKIYETAQLLQPESKKISTALSSGERVFIASANTSDRSIGEELISVEDLPETQGPLPLRLLKFKAKTIEELLGEQNENSIVHVDKSSELVPIENSNIASAPIASGLNLTGTNEIEIIEMVKAEGIIEEILACFQMLSRLMQLPYRKDSIEKMLRDSMRRGQTPNLQQLGQLAATMGLHVIGTRVKASLGTRLQMPAVVSYKSSFALAVASNANGLQLASPRKGWVQVAPEQLESEFPDGIELLLVDRTNATPEQRFNFGWFLPAIKRHRHVLIQVLLASFVVQLFGLANPLLIQIIIDKVINQRSLDTLQVLGFALVIVTILEALLSTLRTFLFTETTNRIDLRLGSEVIDHLLRLPLGYFEKRPVGELGTRIAEMEKIRNFLTGQALTTILDAAFSVIYIIVMALYSWLLTLVALAVIPIQVFITLLGAPLFRRQYRQSAQENAKTQSHLVEVLTGIQTVKAQNVEIVSRWKWQELYHTYISRSFEKKITGTTLTQTSQVLQKLSQLLVLWVGATLVLEGKLSLGQLIAFRIISGYVTQPVLRLSNIWQSIQELKVSFERLADVVDTPQESNEEDQKKIPLPPIDGSIRFENIDFRFGPAKPPVLKNINLDIRQGMFVGVVGQSGSGKSTLMKLLPRLYTPESGRILIDDYDIDKVELYSLRRQIGIVPQDPLLFSGSVSDNIALTDPEAGSDEIVQAAQLACAHEFIMELSAGYSTDVGERGGGLSGGQRQRIAIARTLLSNPKLLVMDEATSALDYDTERRVCESLRTSMINSTVFFITHRLSTIRRADLIVMMHQGAIVEQGTHDELIDLRGRYYALFRQQEAN